MQGLSYSVAKKLLGCLVELWGTQRALIYSIAWGGRSSHARQNTHEAKTQSRQTGLDTACEAVRLALLGGAPWKLQAVQV